MSSYRPAAPSGPTTYAPDYSGSSSQRPAPTDAPTPVANNMAGSKRPGSDLSPRHVQGSKKPRTAGHEKQWQSALAAPTPVSASSGNRMPVPTGPGALGNSPAYSSGPSYGPMGSAFASRANSPSRTYDGSNVGTRGDPNAASRPPLKINTATSQDASSLASPVSVNTSEFYISNPNTGVSSPVPRGPAPLARMIHTPAAGTPTMAIAKLPSRKTQPTSKQPCLHDLVRYVRELIPAAITRDEAKLQYECQLETRTLLNPWEGHYRQVVERKDKQATAAKQTYEALDQEVKGLEKQIETVVQALESSILWSNSKAADVVEVDHRAVGRVQDLEAEYASLALENAKKKDTVADADKSEGTGTSPLTEEVFLARLTKTIEAKFASKDAETAKLREELATTKRGMEAMDTKVVAEQLELKAKLSSVEKENTKLRGQVDGLKKTIEAKSASKDTEFANLRNDIHKLKNSSLHALANDTSGLKNKFSGIENKLNSFSKDAETTSEQVARLQEDLEAVMRDLDHQRDSIDFVQEDLSDDNKRINKAFEEIGYLDDKAKSAENRFEKLEQQGNEYSSTANSLLSTVKSHQEQLHVLEKRSIHSTLPRRLDSFQTDLDAHQKALDKTVSKVDHEQLVKKVADLKVTCDDLHGPQAKTMDREHAALTANNNNLKQLVTCCMDKQDALRKVVDATVSKVESFAVQDLSGQIEQFKTALKNHQTEATDHIKKFDLAFEELKSNLGTKKTQIGGYAERLEAALEDVKMIKSGKRPEPSTAKSKSQKSDQNIKDLKKVVDQLSIASRKQLTSLDNLDAMAHRQKQSLETLFKNAEFHDKTLKEYHRIFYGIEASEGNRNFGLVQRQEELEKDVETVQAVMKATGTTVEGHGQQLGAVQSRVDTVPAKQVEATCSTPSMDHSPLANSIASLQTEFNALRTQFSDLGVDFDAFNKIQDQKDDDFGQQLERLDRGFKELCQSKATQATPSEQSACLTSVEVEILVNAMLQKSEVVLRKEIERVSEMVARSESDRTASPSVQQIEAAVLQKLEQSASTFIDKKLGPFNDNLARLHEQFQLYQQSYPRSSAAALMEITEIQKARGRIDLFLNALNNGIRLLEARYDNIHTREMAQAMVGYLVPHIGQELAPQIVNHVIGPLRDLLAPNMLEQLRPMVANDIGTIRERIASAEQQTGRVARAHNEIIEVTKAIQTDHRAIGVRLDTVDNRIDNLTADVETEKEKSKVEHTKVDEDLRRLKEDFRDELGEHEKLSWEMMKNHTEQIEKLEEDVGSVQKVVGRIGQRVDSALVPRMWV